MSVWSGRAGGRLVAGGQERSPFEEKRRLAGGGRRAAPPRPLQQLPLRRTGEPDGPPSRLGPQSTTPKGSPAPNTAPNPPAPPFPHSDEIAGGQTCGQRGGDFAPDPAKKRGEGISSPGPPADPPSRSHALREENRAGRPLPSRPNQRVAAPRPRAQGKVRRSPPHPASSQPPKTQSAAPAASQRSR